MADMTEAVDAREEIEDLFRRVVSAHARKDVDALLACHTAEARIADLAPPLDRRGLDRDRVAEWFATWDGPIALEARDVEVRASGGLAVAAGLVRMRGTKTDGSQVDIWMRATDVLAREGGEWRIVHHHSSVPFHMDGSLRAAVDLEPDEALA